MRKTYSSPDIVFEDFALSTNIAAGCEEKPDNQTEGCGVKWGKKFIFMDGMTGCTSQVTEGSTSGNMVDEDNNGLCYHNPSESYNVFYS